jgi:hypothetical protein
MYKSVAFLPGSSDSNLDLFSPFFLYHRLLTHSIYQVYNIVHIYINTHTHHTSHTYTHIPHTYTYIHTRKPSTYTSTHTHLYLLLFYRRLNNPATTAPTTAATMSHALTRCVRRSLIRDGLHTFEEWKAVHEEIKEVLYDLRRHTQEMVDNATVSRLEYDEVMEYMDDASHLHRKGAMAARIWFNRIETAIQQQESCHPCEKLGLMLHLGPNAVQRRIAAMPKVRMAFLKRELDRRGKKLDRAMEKFKEQALGFAYPHALEV